MLKQTFKESPLVRFGLSRRIASAPRDAGVSVWELAFRAHLNLRGDPADMAFLRAAETALGYALPLVPNTVAGDRASRTLWLGPNEWLVIAAGERETALAGALRQATAGLFVAVTEVGGGQTIIGLRGKHVRDLLAQGCPLDLHPRVFGPGRCAQSHLAKAPILLAQLGQEPVFELIVRRSFADYVWLWLEDAAAQYGLAVIDAPADEAQAQPAARLHVASV